MLAREPTVKARFLQSGDMHLSGHLPLESTVWPAGPRLQGTQPPAGGDEEKDPLSTIVSEALDLARRVAEQCADSSGAAVSGAPLRQRHDLKRLLAQVFDQFGHFASDLGRQRGIARA